MAKRIKWGRVPLAWESSDGRFEIIRMDEDTVDRHYGAEADTHRYQLTDKVKKRSAFFGTLQSARAGAERWVQTPSSRIKKKSPPRRQAL